MTADPAKLAEIEVLLVEDGLTDEELIDKLREVGMPEVAFRISTVDRDEGLFDTLREVGMPEVVHRISRADERLIDRLREMGMPQMARRISGLLRR
ncbi:MULTISPECIES: hypothetical protein [unclassified Nocardia]|uniref:hypothetical protein n=1 Tax=unclassified Nocardia TaxID=2637762 RepID=UPI001CE3C259|nr:MULTISPECIES: hypothetical protein [unclassified Nocardia]